MKIVRFIFLLLCSFTVHAQVTQQWVAIYNGPDNLEDEPKSIGVDKQGNVYVTGYSDGTEAEYDYLTIKYNSEGVKQWDARYNGPGNYTDQAQSLAIDNQGNVYVTGWSCGIGTSLDYATVKYNPEGVEQWVARYSLTGENRMDCAQSIAIDKGGNIYVTGMGRNSSGNYYVTIKYNPEGDEMWVRMHDEPLWSYPYSIKTDNSGNVYVTGGNTTAAYNQDILTVKYSSEGAEQWASRFDGPANSSDGATSPSSLAVDNAGNVYVAGCTNTSATGTSFDFATIKYNSGGGQEWVQYYNGPANGSEGVPSVAVDSSGNIFVAGYSPGIGKNYATIKYNSAGVQQWVSSYNGIGSEVYGNYLILTDSTGNAYVTGSSSNGNNYDFITIKYNPEGHEMWAIKYNGLADVKDYPNASTIDDHGNIYVTGYSTDGCDFVTIKYAQNLKLSITKPATGSKFIAGQIDTIRWNGGQTGQIIQIDYSVDEGNAYITIDSLVLANSSYYTWDVPDSLLTTKAKIRITDMDNATVSDESDVFRIKPYVLTRLNEDSTYYAYRKDRDQFGFRNSRADMWPQNWSDQFNYQGTDPFTGEQYKQDDTAGIFAIVDPDENFPDWVSWVNAFSVKACYKNTNPVVYIQKALWYWWSTLHNWEGSCYGIAVANALVFSHKEQFQTEFPNFIINWDPINVISGDGVKSAVNELFTYNFGQLAIANQIEGPKKTPYQTLQEIKQMLTEDNVKIKTLYIGKNSKGKPASHEILAYGLEQDQFQDNLYYVKVYDNAYPNSHNPITIDLSANGGSGSWSTPDYPSWGGGGLLFLNAVVDSFFNNAIMPTKASNEYKSPFILPDDRLEIRNNPKSDIKIRSFNTGQVTGYSNNEVLNEIPNSYPLLVINGSETAPYAYLLPTPTYDFFIIEMTNFQSDRVNTFFFTGNKSFLYQRYGATQSQTDLLYFDGGVHANNPDGEIKTFSLQSLITETTQEKLCVFRSLKTNVNEEVVIDIPDSNSIKITTYSTAQEYNIELNYLTGSGIGKFICNNITLPENSSHTIIPDWENLTDSMLIVVVDLNDDYIIDDTLYFNNQYTGFGDDENTPFLPRGFSMSQNYPNPFNKTTSITYQLPAVSKVTLKVFDLVGKEVATLVNENKPAGNYKVEFDGSHFPPGIYFYKLQTGNSALTRKMILQR